jgi:hypothetical protein
MRDEVRAELIFNRDGGDRMAAVEKHLEKKLSPEAPHPPLDCPLPPLPAGKNGELTAQQEMVKSRTFENNNSNDNEALVLYDRLLETRKRY